MKLSDINRKKYALKMLVYTLVGMLAMPVGGLPVAQAASCMDIADIPLESMEEEGPGLIMFVVDDSGSMDWSTMVDPSNEASGVFHNYEYVFIDPGDDLFKTDSNGDNLENSFSRNDVDVPVVGVQRHVLRPDGRIHPLALARQQPSFREPRQCRQPPVQSYG